MEPCEHRVLVVGSGSIGRRHLRNLLALGLRDLAVCDPDPKQLVPLVTELGLRPFTQFEQAVAMTKPDLVLICTPPVCHVPQALAAVRAGAHVFIEKPLSPSLDGLEELYAEARARHRIIQVGYNLRFHRGLQQVKAWVDEGTIGRILWVHAEFGQYLADWRPSQDYRQSYTARQELGGGIILDATHELDYLIWLLGEPTEVICLAGRVSSLETDVEDCATLLLRFSSGAQADVHVDFIQHGYSRSCKLVGERGTIIWDYAQHEVRRYHAPTKVWETKSYDDDPNQMYLTELQHFLNCVDEGTSPLVDLKQAQVVLRVALTAKAAAVPRSVESLA